MARSNRWRLLGRRLLGLALLVRRVQAVVGLHDRVGAKFTPHDIRGRALQLHRTLLVSQPVGVGGDAGGRLDRRRGIGVGALPDGPVQQVHVADAQLDVTGLEVGRTDPEAMLVHADERRPPRHRDRPGLRALGSGRRCTATT